MSPKAIITVVLGVILAVLVWFSYSTYAKLQVAELETKRVQMEFKAMKAAKSTSDKANAQLTRDLNRNQQVVTETITKIVQVPVSSQETCMSDVLKQSLKD